MSEYKQHISYKATTQKVRYKMTKIYIFDMVRKEAGFQKTLTSTLKTACAHMHRHT